jgi:hypothetical protein
MFVKDDRQITQLGTKQQLQFLLHILLSLTANSKQVPISDSQQVHNLPSEKRAHTFRVLQTPAQTAR